MIEFFSRSMDAKKEEFMVQALVGAMLGDSLNHTAASLPSSFTDQPTALRQNISLYLGRYFKENTSTDVVNWFVEKYVEHLKNLIQDLLVHGDASQADYQQALLFNDYQLFASVIGHPKLATESCILIYDLLSQVIFIEQFTDYFSMRVATMLLL